MPSEKFQGMLAGLQLLLQQCMYLPFFLCTILQPHSDVRDALGHFK